MFVDVKVNGQVLRAMVDTGATQHFLSDRIVARLGLRVDKGNSSAYLSNKAKTWMHSRARTFTNLFIFISFF